MGERREGEGTVFGLDRKIFSSDIWASSPWTLKIWIYLIGQANHQDKYWNGILVKRGETAKSLRTIRKAVGYKIGYRWKYPAFSTVRSIYEALTKAGRISTRTDHLTRITTILNYNKMQLVPGYEPVGEPINARSMPDQCPNYNNNENNENNGIDVSYETSSVDGEAVNGPMEEEPDPPKTKPCPHQKILNLYHEILPALNTIQVWDDTAKGWLKTRWREDPERQCLEWWRRFFTNAIKTSDFLMGDKNSFKADMRWIIRSQNFAKIMNGNYINRGGPDTGSKLTDKNIKIGQEWVNEKMKGVNNGG